MTRQLLYPVKFILLSLFYFLICFSAFSQSTQKMKCETVIYDNNDFLVINQTIGMRIQVMQGSEKGQMVYSETLSPTTQADGSVVIVLGNGKKVSGNYDLIDWQNNEYVLVTEIDLSGGKKYKIKGTCDLIRDKNFKPQKQEKPVQDESAIDVQERAEILNELLNQANAGKEVPVDRKLEIKHELSDASCFGKEDGFIDITIEGDAPPYRFLWSTGDTTEDLRNVPANEYELSVWDSEGNKKEAQFSINEPKELVCSAVAFPETEAGNDGKINLSVDGGALNLYSYKWSNNSISEDIAHLSAGVYTVTVTDFYDCKCSTTVVVERELFFKADIRHASCFGASDGAVKLSIGGGEMPYSVFWDNDTYNPDNENLKAGDYFVAVIDKNGQRKEANYTVSEPSEISITDSLFIGDGTNGSVSIDVNGGIPPYTFLWSNGATTKDIANLSYGEYTLTVMDASNCQVQKSMQLINPLAVPVQEKMADTLVVDTLVIDTLKLDLPAVDTLVVDTNKMKTLPVDDKSKTDQVKEIKEQIPLTESKKKSDNLNR
ncbi:MAG: SprB repeat-containing protein [Bacteroidales bacterium]|nr:SprB repeat-containing protein [Bacteroidales bacterium]